MDRRESLGLLFGKRAEAKPATAAASSSISLDPYTGPWNFDLAARLLRRTMFGPNKAQIKQAVEHGLEVTISNLFQDPGPAELPIYFRFEEDPLVPLGETWVNELETSDVVGLSGARKRSSRALNFKLMHEGGVSIREKMFLFWHNHFVVEVPGRGRRMQFYTDLLRNNALGNFRTLVEEITIDSAMLYYLNGTQNAASGPNENYARELLELFTIGKGPAAGPGDYTHYTEDDVIAIARALTGWRGYDVNNDNDPSISSFVPSRHDTEDKQLSHRFDFAVITDEGDQEYKRVIDIILQKEETSKFICRKLIRWFVHMDITEEVEAKVVTPMAQMLVADNYELKRPLRALLSSQYFFDESIRGCMVTHPIDHYFRLINTFEVALPEELLWRYEFYHYFHQQTALNQMELFRHPSVAGWTFMYQAPQYDKLWINAVSLPTRQNYSTRYVNGFNRLEWRMEIDVLAFVDKLDDAFDINNLINETASILFSFPLSDNQLTALKETMIPGLPDFEWTVEYGDYVGGNAELEESIVRKLKNLIGTMVKMPEFYLH